MPNGGSTKPSRRGWRVFKPYSPVGPATSAGQAEDAISRLSLAGTVTL